MKTILHIPFYTHNLKLHWADLKKPETEILTNDEPSFIHAGEQFNFPLCKIADGNASFSHLP